MALPPALLSAFVVLKVSAVVIMSGYQVIEGFHQCLKLWPFLK